MITDSLPIPYDFPVTWRFPEDAQRLWSQDRLHYPDPVTPLEFSLIEEGVDAGLAKAVRAYDIPIRVHDRHFNSYLYIAIEQCDLTAEDAVALAQQSSAKLHHVMANLRTSWDATWLPEIQRHLATWVEFDRAGSTWTALRQHLAQAEQCWQRVWEIHFMVTVPSELAMSEFADFYTDLFEDSDPFAPYNLLAGFPSKTLESGQELWALSRRILGTSSVGDIFREHAVADVIPRLGDCVDGRKFLSELYQYLAVHGERADKVSLHYPYWVEDPTPVIKNLQNYVQQPDRDLPAEMRQVGQRREEQSIQFRLQIQDYPQPVRDKAEFLLGAAQAGAFLKEEHGYWIDHKASYGMRRLLLTIGGRLVEAGVLADEVDLFYLQLDELKAVLADDNPPRLFDTEHRAQVANRKAEAERFAQVSPPPLLGTLPEGPRGPESTRDSIAQMFLKIEGEEPPVAGTSDLIVGNAGSPGVVQGTVKVVHELGEATKLQPGDILVADTTAPPWTPLFASAGGLVTNSGGILSHSAVVAREYGIPAVVGASRATERLQDGQWVEVDGSRGTVRILR